MILSLRSQVAFAESSIRDRIAFAPAPRRNRTEFLVCREKASKVAPLCLTGRFLWSGLGVKIAELRPFLAFFEAILGNFSAVQTAWRRERNSNPRYGFRENFSKLRHINGVLDRKARPEKNRLRGQEFKPARDLAVRYCGGQLARNLCEHPDE